MSFARFLISKVFLRNLLFAVILTAIIYFAVFFFLKIFTHHNESILLPDFTGLTIDTLRSEKEYSSFEFVVIDSVYDTKLERESVVSQDPPPDSHVKKGRKIYLTIVAHQPEKVSAPDLSNLSVRQAVSLLETYGLKAGKLSFIPMPEVEKGNPVLFIFLDGDTLKPNTMIEKGSVIDLIAGKTVADARVPVPFLIGLTFDEAVQTMKMASLNLGRDYFLEEKDPVHSKVYRQDPDFEEGSYLPVGSTLNIWLRSDLNYNFKALIDKYKPDTTQIIDKEDYLELELNTID